MILAQLRLGRRVERRPDLRGGDAVRLGRNLKHLITLLDELQALGVGFVSLAEGIDATTPAGELQMHILGAIAEFERGRIVERVKAGLAKARAAGTRLGRRRSSAVRSLDTCAGLSHAAAATRLGVSVASIKRWRRVRLQPGAESQPSGT
jgi:DNA invertase Pin-like site-specific DNA recombinase